MGVVKTCGSFAEVKKPEHALKLFIRFVLAKAAISYCMDIMLAMFSIAGGTISTIMSSSGLTQTAAVKARMAVMQPAPAPHGCCPPLPSAAAR